MHTGYPACKQLTQCHTGRHTKYNDLWRVCLVIIISATLEFTSDKCMNGYVKLATDNYRGYRVGGRNLIGVGSQRQVMVWQRGSADG